MGWWRTISSQSAGSVLCGLLCLATLDAHGLQAGDLAFTSLNADEDGWSVVMLVDVPIDSTVFFSDNAWASQTFSSGDGVLRWNSGNAVLAAGTVVRFSRIDSALNLASSAGRLQREIVAGSTAPNVAQSGDTVYAYLGTDALTPTRFLAAISTAGFQGSEGNLEGTELAAGVNATDLPAGTEGAAYAGPRDAFADWDSVRFALNDGSRWDSASGQLAEVVPLTEPFLATPIPELHAAWLALAGTGLLWVTRRRRQGSERITRQLSRHLTVTPA